MLPPEQIENIKKQVISLLEKSLPESQIDSIKKQIMDMNAEQLETFLKQNNLMGNPSDTANKNMQQCVFCSIVSGEIDSYKIDENKKAVAVLEINPVSKGHLLVIPKEHFSESDKIPNEAHTLSKKLSKKIKSKLKPKKVDISFSNIFGHEIINILPVYNSEDMNSKRIQAKPEELFELQKKLERKKKMKRVKIPKTRILEGSKIEKLWLPKRIP